MISIFLNALSAGTADESNANSAKEFVIGRDIAFMFNSLGFQIGDSLGEIADLYGEVRNDTPCFFDNSVEIDLVSPGSQSSICKEPIAKRESIAGATVLHIESAPPIL